MKKKKIVLSFDLDFTLIDNREGIVNSFNYALKKHDFPEVDRFKVETLIGTPLDVMFSKFTDFSSSILSSTFREYYGSKGIYQVKLYPGVINKLKELRNAGFLLGVITSKKQEMAIKLLKFLNLFKYFDHVIGETSDIKSKDDPNLKEFLFKKYPFHTFVVVGDHPSDKILAENLNCPFIGVLTGNHSIDQLKQGSNSRVLILGSVIEISEDIIISLF